MALFLIIVACIWFGLGTIFVLALMCAARRPMPSPEETRLNTAPIPATDSSLRQQTIATENEDVAPAESGFVELVDDQVAR